MLLEFYWDKYFKNLSNLVIFVNTSEFDGFILLIVEFFVDFGKDQRHFQWTTSQICMVRCNSDRNIYPSVGGRAWQYHHSLG